MSSTATELKLETGDRQSLVTIQSGCLRELDRVLVRELNGAQAIVIADSNVAQLYLPQTMDGLGNRFAQLNSIVFPAGEESKSIEMALRLWEQCHEFSADRSTVIVALGGGVVGDLAGFVAATFMRGLRLVQIPTTLMAQVDSSVGGKTGINLAGAKNMVGSFWQPHQVVIDPDVLATLPARELRSGLAEVVKYGAALDAGLFARLEGSSASELTSPDKFPVSLIGDCCRIKASVVSRDERETSGLRARLNFGHTFGHAIESFGGFGRWLHGEAISIGMLMAARLSCRLGLCDGQVPVRLFELLRKLELPTSLELEDKSGTLAADLLQRMKADKKRNGGDPRLVLLESLGDTELFPWPGDQVVEAVLSSGSELANG